MKRTLLPAALLLVVLSNSSCKKETVDCNLVPAKVLRFDCDRVIFQLLTNETIGDASWEDYRTGIRYSNVVSYHNTCRLSGLAGNESDTIYVKLAPLQQALTVIDCYQCQAISQQPPQTQVNIAEIQEAPCNNENGAGQ